MHKQSSGLMTWCFRCNAKRLIINKTWRETENFRKLCEGKCDVCKGNVALMCGYSRLPDNIYSYNEKKKGKQGVGTGAGAGGSEVDDEYDDE